MKTVLWSAPALWRFASTWGGGRARGDEGALAGKRQRAAALHTPNYANGCLVLLTSRIPPITMDLSTALHMS
jgi:hypothetical protein